MKRKITQQLETWKNSSHRKPLVVMGARQVGKTYSVLEFGRANYAAVLHVDFAEHPDLSRLFSGDVEPDRLVRLLGEYFSTRVDPETTLLFFDEVQRCPEAITSLKYFCESAPEYYVIAAGSLLGTTVRQRAGLFPVGKVDMITMRPLDFEEYLWALGHEDLADLIREASWDSRAFALHDRCMELYRRYLLVGGMPEPLSLWIAQGRMDVVRRTQENIATGYLADITQYTEGLDGAMVLAAWRSMPRQLAKDNTKFQYSAIRSGARSKTYAPCIEWLKDAGLVEPVTHITDAVRPLEAFAEDNNFKLYLLDTGLLSSLYRARMEDVLPQGACSHRSTELGWRTCCRKATRRPSSGEALPKTMCVSNSSPPASNPTTGAWPASRRWSLFSRRGAGALSLSRSSRARTSVQRVCAASRTNTRSLMWSRSQPGTSGSRTA